MKSTVGSVSSEVAVFAADDPKRAVVLGLGFFFVCIALMVLWNNEKRAVRHALLIDGIEKACT